jgi:hypothetical protein
MRRQFVMAFAPLEFLPAPLIIAGEKPREAEIPMRLGEIGP